MDGSGVRDDRQDGGGDRPAPPAAPGRRTPATDALVARAAAVLASAGDVPAERLSGAHNPWGAAATILDAWAFLDLCHDAALLDRAEAVMGPDIVLWDCHPFRRAGDYRAFVAAGHEGAYWPADPLAGAVLLVPLVEGGRDRAAPVPGIAAADLAGIADDIPLAVIRLMSGASFYRRDAAFAANRRGMEEQVLLNYAPRPLWLLRGRDRAGSDFTTGFSPAVARWADSPAL